MDPRSSGYKGIPHCGAFQVSVTDQWRASTGDVGSFLLVVPVSSGLWNPEWALQVGKKQRADRGWGLWPSLTFGGHKSVPGHTPLQGSLGTSLLCPQGAEETGSENSKSGSTQWLFLLMSLRGKIDLANQSCVGLSHYFSSSWFTKLRSLGTTVSKNSKVISGES